jgi:hypothetical protein
MEYDSETGMTKRLGFLASVTVALALVRCGDDLPSDQECHDIHAVSSAGFAVGCPTGATRFCATTAIVATSSSHARSACDACFGTLACSLSIACGSGPDATSWQGSLPEPQRPTGQTEYQFGSGLVAAGEISSGRRSEPACQAKGRWAP